MQIGDIVTFWNKNDDAYYMGVVMEINEDMITVQDIKHNQYDVPSDKVRFADDDDILEELRCLYGFYH